MTKVFAATKKLRAAICFALALAAAPGIAADLSVKVVDAQGQPLANAALLVTWPGAPAASGANQTAEVAQRHLRFQPHMLVIPVGTSVFFPNYDRTRHHVYSFSKAKTFNLKLYVGRPERPIVFDHTGVVTLGCNIHDQMQAFVVVTDKPRWAITNAQGEAVIHDVPATNVTLSIWHPWMASENTRVTRRFDTTPRTTTLRLDVTAPPPPPNEGSTNLQAEFDRIAG